MHYIMIDKQETLKLKCKDGTNSAFIKRKRKFFQLKKLKRPYLLQIEVRRRKIEDGSLSNIGSNSQNL